MITMLCFLHAAEVNDKNKTSQKNKTTEHPKHWWVFFGKKAFLKQCKMYAIAVNLSFFFEKTNPFGTALAEAWCSTGRFDGTRGSSSTASSHLNRVRIRLAAVFIVLMPDTTQSSPSVGYTRQASVPRETQQRLVKQYFLTVTAHPLRLTMSSVNRCKFGVVLLYSMF